MVLAQSQQKLDAVLLLTFLTRTEASNSLQGLVLLLIFVMRTKASSSLQGLATTQSSAAAWEAQAQDNLQQVDQLKSLLQESAFWGTETVAEHAQTAGVPTNKQGLPQGNQLVSTVPKGSQDSL